MANKIEKGLAYKAVRVRSGVSDRGNWELIVTQDERKKNDITIYPVNMPSGVVEGQQFMLSEIKSVSNGFRKDPKGLWIPNVTVEGMVVPIKSEFDAIPDSEFKAVDITADDPWENMGKVEDLPF